MPLQCPITLVDTYRLKCADLSGIRLSLITISKNNLSAIHISQGPEWAFPSLSYYGSCFIVNSFFQAEKTSTTSQLMEHVLDWMNARRENPKFTQAKEFLHGEIFGRIKLVCITLSCFVALVTLTSCSVEWFNIKATKKEPVHCEISKV